MPGPESVVRTIMVELELWDEEYLPAYAFWLSALATASMSGTKVSSTISLTISTMVVSPAARTTSATS